MTALPRSSGPEQVSITPSSWTYTRNWCVPTSSALIPGQRIVARAKVQTKTQAQVRDRRQAKEETKDRSDLSQDGGLIDTYAWSPG
jgi:hypothetical protein